MCRMSRGVGRRASGIRGHRVVPHPSRPSGCTYGREPGKPCVAQTCGEFKDDFLDAVSKLPDCSPLVDTWRRYGARFALQSRYLDKLEAGVDLPLVELPEVMEKLDDEDVVDSLASKLSKMMGGEG